MLIPSMSGYLSSVRFLEAEPETRVHVQGIYKEGSRENQEDAGGERKPRGKSGLGGHSFIQPGVMGSSGA